MLKLIYQPEKTEEYIEYEGEIITGNARIGYLAQELTEEQKEETVWEFCYKNPEFYEQSPRELAEIARKLGMDATFLCTGKDGTSVRWGKSKNPACRNHDAKPRGDSTG